MFLPETVIHAELLLDVTAKSVCSRDMEGPGDDGDLSSHGAHKKKHKKHKKHKKKHHQEVGGSVGYTQHRHPDPAHKSPHHHHDPTHKSPNRHIDSTHKSPNHSDSAHKSPHKPQLKLKIKLGGQVLGTKNVPTFTVVPEVPQSPPLMVVDEDEEPLEGVPIEQYRAWLDEDSNLDPLPSPVGAPESEQDEESRWLDALERGELDVNGDLKREIDETLLTARQKALLQKQQAPPIPVYPPPVYARPLPELSQEMIVKREEKARKRRLQAAKKAEESKKQTIERLTKTSKSRGPKPSVGRRGRQPPCPTIRYQHNAQGITISYPSGVPCPTPAEPRPALPAPQLCGAPGCTNMKRYSCSRTGVPLCSLECYHKNLQVARMEGVVIEGGAMEGCTQGLDGAELSV